MMAFKKKAKNSRLNFRKFFDLNLNTSAQGGLIMPIWSEPFLDQNFMLRMIVKSEFFHLYRLDFYLFFEKIAKNAIEH